ncbi:hypothetical protein BC936DRAFT_145825 [Jimgerdemannia flammicorona]|uniref:BTB domain-containing protein n=1 Tax=Jimgerdemannia flammicorona TaxID=994334 RepID=A0A433D948_9FUNG|nr:hypothetical protein BC936DRAFT_145825 [Jimgerdemannia flammicorona]
MKLFTTTTENPCVKQASHEDLRFFSDVIVEVRPETADTGMGNEEHDPAGDPSVLTLYHLHKCIITQNSSFFRAMFTSSNTFTERSTGRCVLYFDDPSHVLPAVITFLYTGHIALSYRNCMGVYALADRLQIDVLSNYVISFIRESHFDPAHLFHVYTSATEHAYVEIIKEIVSDNLLAERIYGWSDNMIRELPIETLCRLIIDRVDTEWESPDQLLRVVLHVLGDYYPQGYCENEEVQEAFRILTELEMPFYEGEVGWTFEDFVGGVGMDFYRNYLEKAMTGSKPVPITEEDLAVMKTDRDVAAMVVRYIVMTNQAIEKWMNKVKFHELSVEMLEWALSNSFVPKKSVLSALLETPEELNIHWR